MKANTTKKELDTMEKVGRAKLVKASLKLYNNICRNCQIKTYFINRRGGRVKMRDYCPTCKEKAEKYLGGLTK